VLEIASRSNHVTDEMKSNLLNEYQASAFIGMSPELLRYLAKHQVKWKDARKLVVAKNVNGALYFEETELRDYDSWLRTPWPAKDNKRPSLPDAIRQEIRLEANMECALCKSSGQAGEAAHIDPVNTSRSNHPHNLIWLCANHHTKFDNGCFGPKGTDSKVIAALKLGLHHFKRTAWQGQAEICKQIAATFSLCSTMQEQLERASEKVEVDAVERIARKALEQLPALASQSSLQAVQPTLTRLANQLAAGQAKKGSSTTNQLATAVSFEAEFLLNSGLVRCPLCKGSKTHSGYDCPVCSGDGAVDKDLEVDLTEFELVECELCTGTGRYNYEDCPVCNGEAKLERWFADRFVFRQFESVCCPLCKGKCRWQGDDCPACLGDGTMLRRAAERIDIADFKEVDCPLCEGQGRYNGDDCPECQGNRTMQRRYADRVDISRYEIQQCPICEGKGRYLGEDCPACGGDGDMSAGTAEQLDRSQYDLVNCPRCKGKGVINGDDCVTCGGNRKMLRIYAERFE
jgi:hypothetical protein